MDQAASAVPRPEWWTPSAGRSSPARSRRRTRHWPARASHPTRYSPGTTERPGRSASWAAPTTCPPCSGHNSYWMWGPGHASDRTVLVVDALGQLKPYFASCRRLTSFYAPYHAQNDWTGLRIGVCTGPAASWTARWPHLKHYD